MLEKNLLFDDINAKKTSCRMTPSKDRTPSEC